jgi:hypothetical protein
MIPPSSVEIISSFHSDLKRAKELVYDKCSFNLTNPKLNAESAAYGACSFELDAKRIQHRTAKITPTKTGQFVTVWKRNSNGITEPFDVSDNIDFIIITVRSGDNFGQFIFPQSVLAAKGIITRDGKEGKRGIRVYPPWDAAANKQATITQTWQSKYFLTIKKGNSTDLDLAKKLFACT